jgi:hypothetical protein
MAVIKKKTKKAISKQVMKLVNKHGPEIATGLVTTLVAGVAGAASAAADNRKKKRARAARSAKKKATSKAQK